MIQIINLNLDKLSHYKKYALSIRKQSLPTSCSVYLCDCKTMFVNPKKKPIF